jgi:hypothetical protein
MRTTSLSRHRFLRRVLGFTLPTLAAAPFASAQVQWTSLASANAPARFCGSAFDTARQRLVAFGGSIGTVQQNTTREWDGSAWLTPNPAQRPSARIRPAMTYDAARGVTVLFGGQVGSAFNSETWTWNGTTWTQLTPPTAPSGRSGAAMAYDSARQVVVLFGGFLAGGVDSGETWEWNGATWTQRAPLASPPVRGGHRLAHDALRQRTVLHGGFASSTFASLADGWLYDGTTWTSMPAGPGSVTDHAFAYDSHRQRVVLFGGVRIAGAIPTDLAETWEWNGTAWTQRAPATSPSPRSSAAAAFDPISGRFLVAGGNASTLPLPTDTWAMTPVSPATRAPFGTGCPSTAGAVTLRLDSLPYVGTDFVQTITNAPNNATIGLLLFGVSDTISGALPLPFPLASIGAPGCTLLVSLDVLWTVPLTQGTGSATWSLPNQPSASGVVFFTQAALLDPGSALAFPVAMSEGRRLTIGLP